MSDRECAAYEETHLLGPRDAEQAARAERHRQGCARCQAGQARLQGVTAAVLGVDAALDDVTRARIGAAIAARLGARPPARRRWLALPIAAAALLALVPISASRRAIVRESAPLRLLRPPGGEGVDRLEVPAGMRMRASLGAGAKVTLLGPADVQVSGADAGTIALRLSAGTLLGEYDHSAGGRLLIESPGATTEVVGTRFSVEVVGRGSRVAVTEGRVMVRPTTGEPVAVGAGQHWSTAAARVVATETPNPGPDPDPDPDPTVGVGVGVRVGEPRSTRSPTNTPTPTPTARIQIRTTPERSTPITRPALAMVDPPAPPASAPAAPVSADAAPALVPPPQPAPPPPPLTAAILYRQAESAMARRDAGESRRRLEEVVTRFPSDPLADTARYDLAQRALGAGDRTTAVRWLAAIQGAPLAEPASFLRCRVMAEQGDDRGARGCFERFRSAYPSSARDPDALAALVQLAWRQDDCAEARLLANEYRRRHPRGAFSANAARIEGACAGR